VLIAGLGIVGLRTDTSLSSLDRGRVLPRSHEQVDFIEFVGAGHQGLAG